MKSSNLASTTLALSLVLLVTSGCVALAQTSSGSVNGTVTDTTDACVPGASVTLTHQETNIQAQTTTNESGLFRFVNVKPGSYFITITLAGFKTAQLDSFVVRVNDSVTKNFTLQVGDLAEKVLVVGGADLVQSSSAELGNVIEEAVIRDLPLNGRNFTQLLILSPGVNPVSTAQGSQTTVSFGAAEGNTGLPGSTIANASVQGQQNRSKVYYIDGIINTSVRGTSYVVLPDIDSLQEFKVQSHNDKAEYGGVTGGVVNMTSKSGTNSWHGSAFEFVRNEMFDARDPQRDRDREKPYVFRQNQFGANIGGPILKDKTFFYAGYDGWRYRDVANIRSLVPTETELNGDFSQHINSRDIFNPFTTRVESGKTVRDKFADRKIPSSLISPMMQGFLKAYVYKPNRVATKADPYNFQLERARKNDANALQVRIDHHFSQSDNAFFRWNEQHVSTFNPQGDVGYRTPDATNRNFGGGFLHSFASNLIMEIRGGVATQPTEDAPYEHPLGVEPQKQLGIPGLDKYAGYILSFTGEAFSGNTYGQQGPRPRGNPNWNLASDLTWLRGNHNFKMGFQFVHISRLQKNQFGEILFNSVPTKDPQKTSGTGDEVAAALLGLPRQMRAYVHDLGSIEFGTGTASAYFQDEWRLRPDLAITYGLRYDYVTRATSDNPRALQSGPDLNTGKWLIALELMPPVCSGTQGPPCLPSELSQIPNNEHIQVTGERFSILKPIRDNWGPRVGLAWRMNARTVLRAGYSLMWDALPSRSQYGQHQFETWGWPQVSGFDTGDLNQTYGGTLTSVDALSSLTFAKPRANPWSPTSAWFNDPNRKDGYSNQWHLEIQREIARNIMVSVAYVGSKNGRLEYAGNAGASPVVGYDAGGRKWTTAEVNAKRPWPHIVGTNWTYEDDTGWSNYHAFQAKVQRRFADGMSTLLSYTWSKSIDVSSGWFNAERGIGTSHIQNYHDQESNKAVSGYDIPHLLTWATVYDLPIGTGKRHLSNGWISQLFGNWQMNWFLLARSGQPITLDIGGDIANIGSTGVYMRPDRVAGVDPIPAKQWDYEWISRAAFAAPVNSFGNAGRNILRADNVVNVDFGLQKNIRIAEALKIALKVEAFNVFNHIDLGNPGTRWDQPTNFGRITSISHAPRQLQFGVRLMY